MPLLLLGFGCGERESWKRERRRGREHKREGCNQGTLGDFVVFLVGGFVEESLTVEEGTLNL